MEDREKERIRIKEKQEENKKIMETLISCDHFDQYIESKHEQALSIIFDLCLVSEEDCR